MRQEPNFFYGVSSSGTGCKRIYGRITSVLLFLLLLQPAQAQQYNNWVFGSGAAVSFNPGPAQIPQAFSGSVMDTNEGCSSISDENGQLLFYTNGKTVYTRNHTVMLHGDQLSGHESAFQAALILALPGSDSIFYVFTADAFENNFQGGYHYSIVNMRRNNGWGEVVVKDALLQSRCTERLTATRHANGTDIWIITNEPNSNVFRSWLLTCNGLQQAPVLSAVGEVMNGFMLMNIGCMKVSSDGKKLCQTHFPLNGDVSGSSNFFQLFDFDAATGQLTNAKKIELPATNVYTAEFSPDSRLLYLTDPLRNLLQVVEPQLATAAAIIASRVSVPAGYGFYGLQLAPDKKIYINHSSGFLSVISNPNVKGAGCGFQQNKVTLGRIGKLGLPFVLQQLDPDPNDFQYMIVDSCMGQVQFTAQTNQTGSLQWSWDFGDGGTSTQQNPVHVFQPPNQTYQVRLKISSAGSCAAILKSKYVIPKGILASAAFQFSVHCDSALVYFTNTSAYADSVQFRWSFGDGTFSSQTHPAHLYPGDGTYPVNLVIIGAGACARDSIMQQVPIQKLVIHASAAQTILEGQTVQLSVSGAAAVYQWSPPDWLNKADIFNPVAVPEETITYQVWGKDSRGCTATDSVKIHVTPLADMYVPSAFTPNEDGRNDVFKPVVGAKYTINDFRVFSRWGQCVFSTAVKGSGWDGRWNGRPQHSGVYVWTLSVRDRQGKQVIRKGSFVLIR